MIAAGAFAIGFAAVVAALMLDGVFGVGVCGGMSLGVLLGYVLADAEHAD